MDKNFTPSTFSYLKNSTSNTAAWNNKNILMMLTDIMKKNYAFLLLVCLMFFAGNTFGQTLLLTDDFTGLTTSSNLAGQSSWTKGGTGPDATVANTTSLTYNCYNGGGGNYVQIPTPTSTASRVYKGFTATTAVGNTFYVSFLLRLSATTSTGNYFITLGDATTGTNYGPRLFAKTSGAGFVLGVSKFGNTANFGSTVLSLNTTYLIVMRFSGVSGSTNDLAYVWVNPSLSTEPSTGSAECSDVSGTDAGYASGNIGNFHWHNRSTNNPTGAFDGIRVAVASTSASAWTTLAASTAKTVTFTANGGTGSDYTQTACSSTALTANAFTRSGYTFTGWNTIAGGGGTAYANGASYPFAANTTLYAQWTLAATYTVTYDGNGNTGGTAPTDGSSPYASGSNVTVLGAGTLVKTGYTFSGWNTAANGSGTSYAAGSTISSIAANTILYAQWTVNTYTLTYDGNTNTGGSVPSGSPFTVNYNASVTVLGNSGTLVKTGYTFNGWNTAANGSGTPYVASNTFSMPAANVTLYAQWTINNYTVTFDGNSQTSGSPSIPSVSGNYNTQVTLATAGTLTKTGFTFSGWNTQTNGLGTDYAAGLTTYTVTGNITLYAKWVAAGSFTVTFNANGGTGTMSPQTTNTSTALTTNAFIRTGYTFAGWNTVAGGGGTAYTDGQSYPFTADVILYAQWTINSYTVTFNGNSPTSGSPSVASVSGNYNTNVTLATAGTLVKTGYTFGGWNTAGDGSGTTYAAGLTTYTVTANVTLYAKWNINSYTVTFDGNSPASGSPSVASVSGNYNTNVTLATVGTLVKTGYTFGGWNTAADGSGTTYAAGLTTYTVTANITLYALWNVNSYTLTFNGNSPTSGSPSIASVSGNYNTNVTLATAGTLVKTGYTFGGWNTAADGSGTTYAAGLTTYTVTANITLYALWNINSYTVTFDGNSQTSGTPSVASVSGNYNTNVTLATVGTLVKTGYTFGGWNTATDGSGTTYTAGLTTYTVTTNITLYAVWTVYVAPCLSEDFTAGANPSLWINSGTGITFSSNYADMSVSAGTITMTSVSTPTSLTFDLSRTTNATAKNLNIEVSTTSQTSGFSTVTNYDHSNTTSGGTTSCTVDLAAYSSYSTVYIRFNKTSGSTSPWRIDNIKVYCAAPCTPPTTSTSALTFINPTASSLDLNFTRGNGDSVLIIAKAGSAATDPSTNTSYNAGDAVGGGTVVYKGIASGINTTASITVGSLSAETQYYFNIYEYKASTKCYQATPLSGNRYTLSTEPSAQPASGFSSTTCTTTSIDLTFPPASGITNADGYIIIMNAGSTPVSIPTDGKSYAVNDTVSSDTVVAVINSTSATTTTIGSLNAGVPYYFTLIPYNANSTPIAQTYNYKTNGSILGTNFSTLINGTSTTSTVTTDAGYTYTQNIAYVNYQSTPVPNSAGSSVGVHEITIKDGGIGGDADALPTLLAGITFTYTGTANTIRSAALFTNTNSKIREATSVAANTITYSNLPDTITLRAPDNDSIKLILRVTFGTTVTDNDKLVFTVSSVSSGNICSYSQLTTPTAVSDNNGANDKNRIEVTATCQKFVQQPTNTQNGATMSPSVSIAAIDNNKNQDLDWAVSSSVACSTPAALTGNPVGGTISSGTTTISALVHVTDGTYTLTASASGLRDTTSTSYVISSVPTGSYRSTGNGNWGDAIWEQLQSPGGWTIVSAPVTGTTDEIHIFHNVNFNTTGAFSLSKIIVENNGTFTQNNTNGLTIPNTAGNTIHVLSGGKFIQNSLLTFNGTNATLELDDNAYYYANYHSQDWASTLWNGTEKIHPNSNFVIWDMNGTDVALIPNSTAISNYTNGTYRAPFGNIIIDLGNTASTKWFSSDFQLVYPGYNGNISHGNLILRTENGANDVRFSYSTTGGDIGTSSSPDTIGGTIILENTFARKLTIRTDNYNAYITVLGDIIDSSGTFRFTSPGSAVTNTLTLNVNGNLTLQNSGIFYFSGTNQGGGTFTLNLKGNLSVSSGAIFANLYIPATPNNSIVNFSGTGDGSTPALKQTVSIATTSTTSSVRNQAINFNVNTGAYVQLINQNLELGKNSTFTVGASGGSTGGTLDFNFAGTTALNITSYSTGTKFFLGGTTGALSGGTLKISSPNGITNTSGTIGNVQVTNAPTYNQVSTFWYTGKQTQVTGSGISNSSTGRIVICDLANNTIQLSPSNSFALTNTTTLSATGGKLDIRTGQFVETETAYITGSTGTLYMSPGTLYKIVKGSADTTNAKSDIIPRMTGSTFPYTLTGGTIELGGSSFGNYAQVLRSDDNNYDYHNLTFSGSNTSGTDFKWFTDQTSVTDSLYITGTAIVDCRSTNGAPRSFVGSGGLVMDGGRFRIKNTSGAQPELAGDNVAYSLTGGTVEFYSTTATQQQLIRGNYTSALSNPPLVNYYNIDINAAAANWSTSSTFADAGNVNMASSFKLTGTLNVNAPAVFRMDETDNISNGTGTSQAINIKDYAGLLYGSPNGITASDITTSGGNIRTSGTRNFSSKASYGFIGNGDMFTGSGLPATTNGLYVYKYLTSNKVTLSNTLRADSILKMRSGHIVTGSSNLIELGKDVSNLGTLDYTTGYVVGKMRRWFNNTNGGIASGLYPLGEDVSGLKNRNYLIEFTNAPSAGGSLDVNFNPVSMGLAGVPLAAQVPAVGTCSSPFAVTSTEDQGYWIGTPQSGTLNTTGNYTLAITGEGFSLVSDMCQLTLLKRVGTGDWTTPGTHLQPTGTFAIPTVSRSNISGFSNFGFGGGPPNPLPVELTSFTGTCLGDGISRINWSTASELNSKYFILQRSEDGVHFATIAIVPAAGNSSQLRNYTVLDSAVMSKSNYYRLTEVDIDNKQTIYSFISVECKELNGTNIYYNEAKVVVEINSNTEKQVSFNVFEVSGKLLHQENRQIQRGYNNFSLAIEKKLAKGIYVIQMIDGKKVNAIKLWVH